MRNTSAPSTAGQIDLGSHPVFNVVLAYDEYASGIRAKQFFETLAHDHGELFQFICHLWKFEVLREPRLFDIAARDAARADMIVLAIRQSQELPAQVRRWIEQWLPSKQANSGALVALLGGRRGQFGSTTAFGRTLRQLTENVNVQVFCKEIDWPAMDSTFAAKITKPQLREQSWRHAPLPSPYVGQPRWWGLNE